MNKSFSPVLDPEIAERIAQAVAYLEVPGEALLLQAYADLQRQIEARRRAVQEEIEQSQDEGFAALSRILLDADDVKAQPEVNYFNRS